MVKRVLSSLVGRWLIIIMVLAAVGYGLVNRYYLSDRSLITHEPCGPPCWHGITPGVSTREEALEALSALPFVRKSSIRLETRSWKDAPQVQQERLSWTYHLSRTGGGRGGVISIQDGMVMQIYVYYMIPYSLGQVIHRNDEPTLYKVGINPDNSLAYAIHYPEKGLRLSGTSYDFQVFDNSRMVRATISEKIRISRATYHPPMNVEDYYQVILGYSLQRARWFADFYESWPGLAATVEIERN